MRLHGKGHEFLVGLTIDELKMLYVSLWNDLKNKGTLGVDEEASDLLHDLQTVLQQEAHRQGVDVSLHAEWAEWAGLDNYGCSRR